jgi:hypothetical protein
MITAGAGKIRWIANKMETLDCLMGGLEGRLKEFGWLDAPDNAVIVPIPAKENRSDETARVERIIFEELGKLNCFVYDLDGKICSIAAEQHIKLPEGSFNDPKQFYFQYFIKDQPKHPIYIMETPEESKSLVGPELTIAMHLPNAQPKDWPDEYKARLDVLRDFMLKFYRSYSKMPAVVQSE